jgi:hypothetical protein
MILYGVYNILREMGKLRYYSSSVRARRKIRPRHQY